MTRASGVVGPIRTCVGCRRRSEAKQLVRIALISGDDGEPSLVVSPTAPGRGAWLCRDLSCLDLARKRKAFSRAFRAPVEDAWVLGLRTGFPPGPGS